MQGLTFCWYRSSRALAFAPCPLLTMLVLLLGSTLGQAQISQDQATKTTPAEPTTEDPKKDELTDLVIRGFFEYQKGDFASAAKSFESAARMGNSYAQHRLAWMYFTGEGVERDGGEAATWFRKAADQGIADAQHMLGLIYQTGVLLPQNYAEAAKWYSLAARQGYDPAQALLGQCYANGQGVPQDHLEAAKWYRLAADQGNATGQIGLGYAYWLGYGVPQDYVRAHMWFNLAAAKVGGVEGMGKGVIEARDSVAAQMTPSQIAEAQKLASEWKPKASETP